MFKIRRKQKPGNDDLPQFCYRMAYFVLPKTLFADAHRTSGYFTQSQFPTGPYLYALACSILETEAKPDEVTMFQTYSGQLTPAKSYYILQYPPPPPLNSQAFSLQGLKSGSTPVLAPFFSAIIHAPETDETAYYILGQRPFGGTTLRRISPEGINANLGEGPAPELNAFLESLRQRI